MDLSIILPGIGRSIFSVLLVSWWIILPLGLFFIWNEFWVWGKNRLWKLATFKNRSILLEIKIPRNIEKSPKAMENVFAALHGLRYKRYGFEDTYFKGEAQIWISFEIVGYAGKVNFYVHCRKDFRNLVESAIYSEYPDAEIVEAEDYVNIMPEVLPNNIYDIYSCDYVLENENPYPIRTYEFFESQAEEQRLDPIAAITEIMSRLKAGEAIWLQYLARPVKDSWKEEGEKIRDKIMQREKKKEQSWFDSLTEGLVHFLKNFSVAAVDYPEWPEDKEKEKKFKLMEFLSPGERDTLKAVEQKISKLGFEAAIRFVYIDRRDSYTPSNIGAINGAIKQFNTQDLNAFRRLRETETYVTSRWLTYRGWFFRKNRLFYRKRQIWDDYRRRWFPPKWSILNTEELATVFHFPILTVKAPLLRRLETRKGEPPVDLPVQ